MPDNLLGGLELLTVAMIVVFLVLTLIIVFVRVLKLFGRGRQGVPGTPESSEVSFPEPVPFIAETIGEPEQLTIAPEPEVLVESPGPSKDEVTQEVAVERTAAGSELLAVITAAITAYQGTQPAPFVVTSVTRTQDTNFDAWQLAGRQRLIDSRRMKLSRR
jgi:hypothetical protein